MVLMLDSQHQYIFDYGAGGLLSAVTMPSVARHTMQTIRSIGYYRNIYTPPESNASVTVDYSEDGQVCVYVCVWVCVCPIGFKNLADVKGHCFLLFLVCFSSSGLPTSGRAARFCTSTADR